MEHFIESVTQQVNDVLERAKEYIIAVKKARGYTNRDLAYISGLSEDTIKNFLSGKTLKNTGFIVVISLATSLGIDLNEMIGYTPPQKAETYTIAVQNENYVAEIKSLCESRIEDVKAMCESRIADNNAMWEQRLSDKDAMWQQRVDDLINMYDKNTIDLRNYPNEGTLLMK